MNRFAAMQDWPLLIVRAWTARLEAQIASYADAESRCPDHKVNPNAVCPPDVASQGNSARIQSG